MKVLILTFLLSSIFACSSKQKQPYVVNLESTLNEIKEREEKFGPTNTSATIFIDKTSDYGLDGIRATNFNLIDIDNDGYTDLVILPDYYSQPNFYRFNIYTKKFEPMDSPFAKTVKASFLLFYDLNRDGILDALVGVINQKTEIEQHPLRIFWGEYRHGKLFFDEDIKAIQMAPAPTSTVALIDYNLDGNLDLFIGNWLQKINETFIPHRDALLVFNKNKYVDQSELLADELKMNADQLMYTHATPTYGAQACDIDQNGFPDILTVSTNGYPNRLWMNRYKVRDRYRYFEDHGITSLYAGDTEGNLTSQGGGRTFAVACADYNNDGMMDIFLGELTHSYDNDLKDKSSILTGSTYKFPPVFVRTEYLYEAGDVDWNQADKRAIWFDYNNDGLLDLLVENTGFPPHTRLILFKQHADHSFENVSKEVGIDIVNPQSSVIADLNRDGRWDIITAQSNLRDARINRRIYVFENQTESKSVPIKFYLRGKKANFHGLGATITLKIKTKKGLENRTQIVSYSYGGLPPQNEEGLLFALNEDEQLESVKVRWPYSESLNQVRAGLEKSYKIKENFLKQSVNITLCEDGDYLIGRLACK